MKRDFSLFLPFDFCVRARYAGERMKRLFLFLLLAGVLTWAALPATAADESGGTAAAASGKAKKGKKKALNNAGTGTAAEEEPPLPAELSPVAAALNQIHFCSDTRPSLTAKYYIYLFSSSTCTFCNRTMPADVEQHKLMRRQGEVELIMINLTDSPEAARAFLEKYDAQFACTRFDDLRDVRLPGLGMPHGIPFVAIVDNNGQVLHSGPGSGPNTVEEWKQHTIGADAVIPPPSPAEQKAEAKARKEAAKAAAKAERERVRAEKRKKKK